MKNIELIDLASVAGGHTRQKNGGLSKADMESDNLIRREQSIRPPFIGGFPGSDNDWRSRQLKQ